MANVKARVSRRDLIAEKLTALGKQIKGALKEALGDNWERLARLTSDEAVNKPHIKLVFDDSLTMTRLNRVWQKIQVIVLRYRASICMDTKVISLPVSA